MAQRPGSFTRPRSREKSALHVRKPGGLDYRAPIATVSSLEQAPDDLDQIGGVDSSDIVYSSSRTALRASSRSKYTCQRATCPPRNLQTWA